MQAVGRLGSYISQGVYTVSGPFHPFGGAVDIVVVEQPDGTLRSSPWFVRFGKFQGVLKSREKVVQISVNGVDAGFQMYLDSKGEAFFLREIDAEPVSGDDDADVDDQSLDLNSSKSSSFDSENGKIVAVGRSNSRRSRVLGLVFGRGSLKGGAEDADGNRERAEIAANLLEIKWSTNLGQDQGSSSSTSSSSGATTHDPSGKDNVQVACVELEEVSGHDGGGVSSESSKVSMVCSTEEGHEVLYLADGETGQIHVHDRVLHVATALLSEGTETEEVTEIAADLGVSVMEVSEFHSQSRRTDCSDSEVSMYDVADFEDQTTSSKPHLGHCSSEKVESICVSTKTSSYSSQDDLGLCENNMKDKGVSSTLSIPPGSLGDFLPSKAASRRSPSPSLEEENFFFSDLDESGTNDRFERSLSPEYIDKEDNLSHENDTEKLRVISSPIVIPRNEDAGEEVGLRQRTESLPNISSGSNSMGQHVRYPLSQSLDSTFPGKDDLKCLKSDEVKVNRLSHEGARVKDYHNSGEFKSTAVKLPPGDPSTNNPSPGGNWRIWPFSLRRSGSRDAMPPTPNDVKNTTSENKMPPTPNDAKNTTSENKICADVNKNELKPNLIKKKVRETTPTSEQIASLNLKEGRNIVTFTFSTSVLGKQEVDAQIYLWKWNSRIVISDVDGTITRSDVLGQFMPLVGVDWSQTGVAHLFSAIKENGYQLLFLSARSISQAYITRQFLLNLKQDGKVLPEGPVVISPDGLFPSLYREVIRRVPHEFKIACLEGIKALFPSDCNPFYAGFGNRETDEISYLKVGIPKGKIFIINPRGEIVVNRSLDTKSYTSMHALVNGMFPPTNSSEQEDFNQWNFWKLPPPAMDF